MTLPDLFSLEEDPALTQAVSVKGIQEDYSDIKTLAKQKQQGCLKENFSAEHL